MSKYIDFDDPENRNTYTGRVADTDWVKLFDEVVHPAGRLIVDVGCGGGIYTRAIAGMGVDRVVGLDSSRLSLDSAQRYCAGVSGVAFVQSDAISMGVSDDTFDGAVERALIHHLQSISSNFREVRRILRPSGILWVQDRTVEDALLPPSDEHIRGHYMVFDRNLRDTEVERRRRESEVKQVLMDVGFRRVETQKIRELRKVFEGPDELYEEITTRRGRSLLHQLDDHRLADLAEYVIRQIGTWPVRERDTWTVWAAIK